MNIIFLTHPDFFSSASMPRFARMLGDGMLERGHSVEYFSALPFFSKLPFVKLKKWFGYIDQFLVFPFFLIFKKLRVDSSNTLFVLCDQALGPWAFFLDRKNLVVHVHDFMALKSALGLYKENPVSFSGKIYQALIRRGFCSASNFVCVSKATKNELLGFLVNKNSNTTVVYNPLNYDFSPVDKYTAQGFLNRSGVKFPDSFIMHVGGNQWYKNRLGVLSSYKRYTEICNEALPILMVGMEPSSELINFVLSNGIEAKVIFLSGLDNYQLKCLYSLCDLFLFPSIAEGFGWPILEAMACGCPVVTTSDAPMTEVGGDVAFYIPNITNCSACEWVDVVAYKIIEVLSRNQSDVFEWKQRALSHVKSFDYNVAMEDYEKFYVSVKGLQ